MMEEWGESIAIVLMYVRASIQVKIGYAGTVICSDVHFLLLRMIQTAMRLTVLSHCCIPVCLLAIFVCSFDL
jgi:hypothetical protein